MHFLVVVLGPDVERQLALYGTQTKLSPYRYYEPPDEIEHARSVFRRDRSYGIDPDDTRAVVAWLAGDDPGEGVDCDEHGWYYWSTYNWKSRWDYWTIGSRQSLLSQPGDTVVRSGLEHRTRSPDPERTELWHRAAPGQRVRSDQALKASIDFEAMEREALEEASRTWEAWEAVRDGGQRDEQLEKQVGGFTREQHLARSTWHSGDLVVDGLWHERGDRGLRVDVDDERVTAWTAFVREQIGKLPDDGLVSAVDCHT